MPTSKSEKTRAQPAKHSQKTTGLPNRFSPAIAQMKTGTNAAVKTSPTAPPVYRPQPTPAVLQRKTKDQSPATQTPRKPVYRSNALSGVMEQKTSTVRTVKSSPTPLVAHSKSGIQLKGRPSRVIQRAEISVAEEKKVNLRYAVLLKVSLNGSEIGAYVSKTSRYAGASEHDHAEDGIIHAIQGVLTLLELSGGKPTVGMSDGDLAIAGALRFDTANILRIYNLTASPCTSSTTKKKTSNKGAGEGCTEQLIDLASKGLTLRIADQILPVKFKITVEADHLYQPGDDGPSRDLSKVSSADAIKRMIAVGITVKISK